MYFTVSADSPGSRENDVNDRTKKRERANRRAGCGNKGPDTLPHRLAKIVGVLLCSVLAGHIAGSLLLAHFEAVGLLQALRERWPASFGFGSGLPEQLRKLGSWHSSHSAKHLNPPAGRVAVLSASEYAAVLDNEEKYGKFEILYVSEATRRFVVFFETSRNLDHSLSSLPNYFVTLQSLRSLAAEKDPRELMQWFHEDWSQTVGHRFPLSIDQKYPTLQFQRIDETRFWMRGAPFLNAVRTDECMNHGPMTIRTTSAQAWYAELRDEAGAVGSVRMLTGSGERRSARQVMQKPGFVLLHDSVPDIDHEELVGQIRLTSDFGTHSGVGYEKAGVHGTHVAGLLAASRNRIGVAGVVPGAHIVVEPFPAGSSSQDGRATLREVVPSLARLKKFLDLQRALTVAGSASGNGSSDDRSLPRASAQVVLLTYASEVENIEDGQAFQVVLEDILREHDVLIVVPAGNRSFPTKVPNTHFVPAELSHLLNRETFKGVLLPIGASDVCSRPAWFSNKAPPLEMNAKAGGADVPDPRKVGSNLLRQLNNIDSLQFQKPARQRVFYAPGQSVYSTFPSNDYGFLTGTSAAAALTAGVAFAISESLEGVTARHLEQMLEKYARPMKSGSADFMIDSAAIVEQLSRDERFANEKLDMRRAASNLIQK